MPNPSPLLFPGDLLFPGADRDLELEYSVRGGDRWAGDVARDRDGGDRWTAATERGQQ